MSKEKTDRIGENSDGFKQGKMQSHSIMQTPAPNSQNAEILAELQSGKTLTAYQMHMMGIQCPSTRVLELRRMGWPIVCIMEENINKRGKKVQRGRYFLAAKQEGKA